MGPEEGLGDAGVCSECEHYLFFDYFCFRELLRFGDGCSVQIGGEIWRVPTSFVGLWKVRT